MMNTIVEEKLISFKKLEQKVFQYVCKLGCEITRIILESYAKELAANSIMIRVDVKPVYGEVEYCRRVYRTNLKDGQKAHVYLLDQAMQTDKIGLISTNLAEKIALTVTESPYRVAADTINSACGLEMKVFAMYKSWDEEKEKQNCTVITLRMKNRRMRWSVNGANNLAKALYRKENSIKKSF